MLVIKKEVSVQVSNEIGAFFRGHNIMEYKSPEDHLNIDSFSRLWRMRAFINPMAGRWMG